MDIITYNAYKPARGGLLSVEGAYSQGWVTDDVIVINFIVSEESFDDDALNEYAKRVATTYAPEQVLARGGVKAQAFCTDEAVSYRVGEGRIITTFEPVEDATSVSRGTILFEHSWVRQNAASDKD